MAASAAASTATEAADEANLQEAAALAASEEMDGAMEPAMEEEMEAAMEEEMGAAMEETAPTRNEDGVLVFPEQNSCPASTPGEVIETAEGPKAAQPVDEFGALQLCYHNQARAAHGAMDLVWNDSLAAQAQEYAEFLQMNDPTSSGLIHDASLVGVGENLYWATSSDGSHIMRIMGTDAASRNWYETEEDLYAYDGEFNAAAGHFTAMVWKNTSEMGCGKTDNFVVCRYTPQGNILGQFEDNVMPAMI